MYKLFLNQKDKREGIQLLEYIKSDQISKVRDMLNSGISPAKKHSLFQSLESPLVCSVQMRSVALVNLLLSYGAPVNEKGISKGTALEFACLLEEAEIVKVLLEHKADTSFFKEIYHADGAIYYNNEQIIRLLMNYNADPLPLLKVHYFRLRLPVLNLLIETGYHRVPKHILDFWEEIKQTEEKYGRS